MGKLTREREESARAFCGLLARRGIRAWVRKWYCLGVALEGVPECHEFTLEHAHAYGEPAPALSKPLCPRGIRCCGSFRKES